MEEKLGQSTAVLFKYEKLILAEEETTSAGGCGVSLAAFSCPATPCHLDRLTQGMKRPQGRRHIHQRMWLLLQPKSIFHI